jgi:hypothetical protein
LNTTLTHIEESGPVGAKDHAGKASSALSDYGADLQAKLHQTDIPALDGLRVTLYPVRKVLAAQPVILQLAAAIILTVVVATASYYLIERPFLKLKKVWANYRRPLVATV